MVDISTTYMGLKLRSPIVVAACSLSGKIENIKRAEEAGAGALVIKSLFEEQLNWEAQELEDEELVGSEKFAESLTYFPPLEHAGPREHLMWVEKSRKEVRMPLIGSINAVGRSNWASFARQMQEAGVDALELNPYAVQTDPARTGAEIERELLGNVEAVLAQVKIPVSVKLSPFYTSLVSVAAELDRLGVKALVCFNRFLQPDININTFTLRNEMSWSRPDEIRLGLRYIAILYGKIQADLAASGGVHGVEGVAKLILAGASVTQVASILYLNRIGYITTMNRELAEWMTSKRFERLDDFRGRMSQKDVTNPFAFERAQYVELLMRQRS